ncbi:hypothetical protein Gpo141_00013519 [Globisporangium polare]
MSLLLARRVWLQACFDDAKLCPGGEMMFREPQRNCEFGACFDIDAQMQDVSCDNGGSTCANGDIVYRDASNSCNFPACPTASPPPSTAISSAPSPGSSGSSSSSSGSSGKTSCPRDAFVCPGGGYFVRRNVTLGCAFNACPPT